MLLAVKVATTGMGKPLRFDAEQKEMFIIFGYSVLRTSLPMEPFPQEEERKDKPSLL